MGNPKVTSGVITLKDQGGGVWGSLPLNPPVDGAGFLRFTSTRYIAEDAGLLDITVERYLGSTGTLSGTITQSDCNRSSGKYVSSPIAVSFADGEFGEKTFTFDVTTAPTDGPYWINLTLNIGPAVPRHNTDLVSEIAVDNGVSVPSADVANIYCVAKTGADTNDGSLASPWLTMQKAFRTVPAGSLVFIREGTYTEHERDGSDYPNGLNPLYPATKGSQTIIKAYPGETPVLDQAPGIDLTMDLITHRGIYSYEAQTSPEGPLSYWRFSGLTMRNAGFIFDGLDQRNQETTRYNEGLIFEDLDMMGASGSEGTNPTLLFLSGVRGAYIRNCKMSHVYEGYDLSLDVHDNNSVIHGYGYTDTVIEDCTLDYASHLIYNKAPHKVADNNSAPVIRRCKFGASTYTAIRFEDHYYAREDAKGEFRHLKYDIYHNIFESQAIGAVVGRTFYSSRDLRFYNNLCLDGIGGIDGFLDTEVYNNIVKNTNPSVTQAGVYAGSGFNVSGGLSGTITPEQNAIDGTYDPKDATTWPSYPGTPDGDATGVKQLGTITYFDHNHYYPDAKWVLGYNAGSEHVICTDLAAWRNATHPHIMPVAVADQNATMFDPQLDVNNRPTTTVPVGRFGSVVGVPNSVNVGSNL